MRSDLLIEKVYETRSSRNSNLNERRNLNEIKGNLNSCTTLTSQNINIVDETNDDILRDPG